MEDKRTFADWLYENRTTVVAAIAAVIVLVVAFGIVSHIRQKKREQAAYFFSKGLQAYSEALVKKDEGKLKSALDYFKKAEEVGAGKESVLAEAMRGRVLMHMGKEKEGKVLIEKALGKLSGSHFEPVFVVATQDLEKLKAYVGRDNPFLEDYVRFELAMLYLEKGQKDAAKKELTTLKGKFPDSPFARDAEKVLEVVR